VENTPDLDDGFLSGLNQRAAALTAEHGTKKALMAELEQTHPPRPRPELLDMIPIGNIQLDQLPEEIQRALFEAFRLKITYDHRTHTAECRVTLSGNAIRAQHEAAANALKAAETTETPPAGANDVPICVVPPTGSRTVGFKITVAVPRRQLLLSGRFNIDPGPMAW
jgi:hypothetical protein